MSICITNYLVSKLFRKNITKMPFSWFVWEKFVIVGFDETRHLISYSFFYLSNAIKLSTNTVTATLTTFDHPAFVNQVEFWSCLSLILCVKNMDVMSKVLCREWQKYQSSLKTETMQFLMNSFILAFQVRTISGLRVIDNGVGPLVFGAEETIVDFALLAADQKATLPGQVQTFYNTLSFPPTQFTICSSATTDAFLTNLIFFQILRHSEDPWITFYLFPQPGNEDPIFKITVKVRCKLLNS